MDEEVLVVVDGLLAVGAKAPLTFGERALTTCQFVVPARVPSCPILGKLRVVG